MVKNNVFIIRQGDTLPELQIAIKTFGPLGSIVPFNLSAVTASTFSMVDDCGNVIIPEASSTIMCSSGGTLQYSWAAEDTTEPGKYLGEFELSFSGGTQMTVPTMGAIEILVQKRLFP